MKYLTSYVMHNIYKLCNAMHDSNNVVLIYNSRIFITNFLLVNKMHKLTPIGHLINAILRLNRVCLLYHISSDTEHKRACYCTIVQTQNTSMTVIVH